MAVELEKRLAWGIIAAYKRDGKGGKKPFVDYTLQGTYLEINPETGKVKELSRIEYLGSGYPKYENGQLCSFGRK